MTQARIATAAGLVWLACSHVHAGVIVPVQSYAAWWRATPTTSASTNTLGIFEGQVPYYYTEAGVGQIDAGQSSFRVGQEDQRTYTAQFSGRVVGTFPEIMFWMIRRYDFVIDKPTDFILAGEMLGVNGGLTEMSLRPLEGGLITGVPLDQSGRLWLSGTVGAFSYLGTLTPGTYQLSVSAALYSGSQATMNAAFVVPQPLTALPLVLGSLLFGGARSRRR